MYRGCFSIIKRVYNQTNHVISRQSDMNLQIIMRSIYLQYGKNLPTGIPEQVQELNNSKIYEFLTQNGKLELTQNIFFQFLSNIDNININSIPIKDVYTYNDVIDLNLIENPQIVNIPLGQRSILGDSIYSFSSNPFKLIDFDKMLKNNADNVITTTNKDLLLSNGFLFENTLYLCSASDVFKSVISKNISETITTKIYFPFLIVYFVKILRILPYWLYFYLWKKIGKF